MVPFGTGRCQFRLWCDCHRQSEDSDSLRDAPRVGGYPPSSGVTLLAPDPIRKGVVDVVSFDELFQFCLVLIGFAALIIQITKKK